MTMPDTTSTPVANKFLCSEPGCKEVAVYTYVWPWGQEGACCSVHRTHVQQKMDALDRGQMNFTVIDPGRPVPISRDERTQLRAGLMTAEEDMRAAQGRAATLYTENMKLREDLRRERAARAELEAQLQDRAVEIAHLTDERDSARADAGEAQQEAADLRAMLPREDSPPSMPRFPNP
jgi:hypothetical protein